MTATITRPKPKKSAATSKQQSPYKRLHVIIPIEDMLWASQQRPSVTQLWQECWTADPYGSRWMPLSTALSYSTFISTKKILTESGLFIFKPDKSIQDGRETVGWMVKNLHGSRMKEFWEKLNAENQEPNPIKQEPNAENTEIDAGSEEMGALYRTSILGQSPSEQAFQKPSRTGQKLLTNSSKEIVRSVSSTQNKNSHCEKTAIAPFGGASPQPGESVEQEKELPAVMDCTTLALVDAVQGESVLLEGENQDCGDEVIDCLEDIFSAAPVAENKFSSTEAMYSDKPFHVYANQKIESSRPSAELKVENSVSRDEDKANHEGDCSATDAPSAEKWSYEAIVARANARPERMQKLKMAGNSGQNLGFDFLYKCWDDPALQIVIKKLLVKYPQWKIAIVDRELVNWEG